MDGVFCVLLVHFGFRRLGGKVGIDNFNLPFFCEGRCGEWKDASGGLDLNLGETPQFTGRAVATLLSRPELTKARSGKVIVVAN